MAQEVGCQRMAPWRSVGGDCGRTPSGVEVLEVLPGQPQRTGSDKYFKCNQSGAKESHITENRHSLGCTSNYFSELGFRHKILERFYVQTKSYLN